MRQCGQPVSAATRVFAIDRQCRACAMARRNASPCRNTQVACRGDGEPPPIAQPSITAMVELAILDRREIFDLALIHPSSPTKSRNWPMSVPATNAFRRRRAIPRPHSSRPRFSRAVRRMVIHRVARGRAVESDPADDTIALVAHCSFVHDARTPGEFTAAGAAAATSACRAMSFLMNSANSSGELPTGK